MDRWEGVGLDIYRRMRVRVHTLDGEEPAWVLRPQRLRGRAALGPLSRRDRGRRRVGGRAARLRDGAAQAPLLSGPRDAPRPALPTRRPSQVFVGNDKTTIASPVTLPSSTRVGR